MATMESLHDLFLDELKDIYSAEKQLLKALPRMAKAAHNDELRQAFERHIEQTEQQVERLQQIFDELGGSTRGKKCKGMEGLLEEGKEMLGMEGDPDVLDAGLIGAAQRVEHYEIAAYGTAIAHARSMQLGGNIEGLLEQSLDEEYETDRLLTQLAEGHINRLAEMQSQASELEVEPEETATAGNGRGRSNSKGRGGRNQERGRQSRT